MSEERATSFGALLCRYRERAGLTQEALAEEAGVSTSEIAALERGRRQRPYPHTVRRLAAVLALSPEERAAFSAAPLPRGERATVAPPEASLPRAPASHPSAPQTSLIGREHDIAVLAELVPGHPGRLVTLTGIGGVGKTRLALAVAAELRSGFADGVRLVELAPIADATLVPLAIAAAVGIPEGAGLPPVEQLAAALRDRRLLLVLDNCEHLADACAELAERLLAGCPGVHILATSRQPLQIARERRWRVPTLPVPDPDEAGSHTTLAACPAVQLFLARAQAVVPAFRLTGDNETTIGEICARLGGLPLALELAAARVGVLAPPQILERLDDAIRLLTGGSRAAPTRQQTLRATLDWSYMLLAPPEQRLLRRLAVFVDSCDIEAVEAVCATPDLPADDVLDVVSRLIDRSMVLAEETDGVARYRMLEPVRQYAAQHLAASAEADAVQARHASYYLALAELAAPELRGPAQVAWLERLERERDNLRATLRWADARGEVAAVARLALALVPFWEGHSHLSEGRRWLETVLALPPLSMTASLRARLLVGVGRLAQWQGDLDAAESYLDESLAASRAAEHRQGIAEALAWLGVVQRRRRASAIAVELLEESLRLYQEVGEAAGVAFVLLSLGVTVGNQGDARRAHALLEQSLMCYRQLGDVRYVAITLTMLGSAARMLGEPERAAVLLREGLAGHRQVGDRAFMAESLRQLVRLAPERQPARAARLLGAAEALRDALGAALAPTNRTTDERTAATIRAQLSDAEFAAAWAAGRALTLEQAVDEAIADTESLGPPIAPVASRPPVAAPEPLTPREREVARLLAQGHTDRQIATALAISVRTVGVHVQHVLAKAGVRSRWQVDERVLAQVQSDGGRG
jgi:predicted ATPase/DNA-binding CsgD family transcriptional regulator/transcriptional regulator with XRE-family HTH domain